MEFLAERREYVHEPDLNDHARGRLLKIPLMILRIHLEGSSQDRVLKLRQHHGSNIRIKTKKLLGQVSRLFR